ncbi:MAG: hypothetical protein N2450_03235 [bacterium]|nr:hypothetical protein [bacterium]
MNYKHALLTFLIHCYIVIFLVGCAKQRNPVVSNIPPLPVQLNAVIQTPGIPYDVVVHRDTAYIADFNAGLARVRLSGTPTLIEPNIPITNNLLSSREMVWVGYDTLKNRVVVGQRENTSTTAPRYLYYVENDSFKIQEGGDVSTSVYLTLFYDQDTTLRSMRCNLDNDGYNLYSLQYIFDPGLQIWYWSWVASSPNYLSPLPYARIRMAKWEKPYSYAATEEYGLTILQQNSYDVAPIEIGHLDLPSVSYWITKTDSIVYVALYDRGIAVVSVSNPTQPTLIKIMPIHGSNRIRQVELSEDKNYLYALDSNDGIYVLSIHQKTNPLQLGLLPCYMPNKILVKNNTLYVADGSQGLLIFK